MTLDDLKSRLDGIETKVDALEAHLVEMLASITVLQRSSLRVLGAGSLLGGVLIFVLSRALGL